MRELTVTLLPDYFYNSAIWPKQDSVVWFETDIFKFFCCRLSRSETCCYAKAEKKAK